MTTEFPHRPAPRHGTLAFLLLGLLSAGCATHEARRGDSVDVSKYPPEIQESYRVFAVRCSRCHTLARPLNARIADPQHWVRYVNRMRLQPGSGIDAANAKIILRFLLYYHGGEQPAPPPPVPSAPPVPATPGDGAEVQPIERQLRYGAMKPARAADGRQS
jgi:hypothetical protein